MSSHSDSSLFKSIGSFFPHLLLSLWNFDSFKLLLGILLARVTDQYTAGKTMVSYPTSSAMIVTCTFRGSEQCWTYPPSSKALPSGLSGLTAGLDLFRSIQPLLQIEQFLFLSLFPVNKVIFEVCHLEEKWGVGKAREKVSEQHPRRKTHGKRFLRVSLPTSHQCWEVEYHLLLFLLFLPFSPHLISQKPSPGRFSWGRVALSLGDEARHSRGMAARDWAALCAAAAELFPAASPSSSHLYHTILALLICLSISRFLSAGYCVCEA